MPRFAVFGTKGADNVQAIIGARSAATTGRGRVYEYNVANTATPADAVFNHILARTSANGTSSAVTPSPLDVADTASIFTAGNIYTADPTIGVTLLMMPLNQRASYRWVAAPGGELIWPATSAAGIVGGLSAVTTSTFAGSMHIDGF